MLGKKIVMRDSDDDLTIVSAACIILNKKKRMKKRRFCVRETFKNRDQYRGTDLLNDLKMTR